MKTQNIFLTFVLLFSTFFISGCSVNNLEPKNIIKDNIEERETITPILLGDINHILFLLKQNDLESLNNRFINPNYGIYEVFKDETNHKVIFVQKLQIDEISNDVDSFEIKEEEVLFDCSPNNDALYGWNKEGVFITPNIKPYLSKQMLEANKVEPNKYKIEDIKKAEFIEKTSYEVIIPYNIIFYITKIDTQWYITLVDKVKTNCSQ